MNTAFKLSAVLVTLFTSAAVAENAKTAPPATAQQALAHAKKMQAQERQAMADRTKRLDAKMAQLQGEIAQLQDEVRGLSYELSKEPKYFADPENDPLRP